MRGSNDAGPAAAPSIDNATLFLNGPKCPFILLPTIVCGLQRKHDEPGIVVAYGASFRWLTERPIQTTGSNVIEPSQSPPRTRLVDYTS